MRLDPLFPYLIFSMQSRTPPPPDDPGLAGLLLLSSFPTFSCQFPIFSSVPPPSLGAFPSEGKVLLLPFVHASHLLRSLPFPFSTAFFPKSRLG